MCRDCIYVYEDSDEKLHCTNNISDFYGEIKEDIEKCDMFNTCNENINTKGDDEEQEEMWYEY